MKSFVWAKNCQHQTRSRVTKLEPIREIGPYWFAYVLSARALLATLWAELGGGNADFVIHRAENTYYLTLYQKRPSSHLRMSDYHIGWSLHNRNILWSLYYYGLRPSCLCCPTVLSLLLPCPVQHFSESCSGSHLSVVARHEQCNAY